ncbi:MAG: alkaline phosphatase family protein [Polyangiaceae bacterium]
MRDGSWEQRATSSEESTAEAQGLREGDLNRRWRCIARSAWGWSCHFLRARSGVRSRSRRPRRALRSRRPLRSPRPPRRSRARRRSWSRWSSTSSRRGLRARGGRASASGGFARLVREGTLVPAMRYAHAVTDTAPGHAALFSGAVPRESGIFGNETIDAAGEALSVVRDDDAKLVYPAINRAQVSSSAKRLRVENVADRLRAAHPGAFVVSVSIKDRGAILPGGHRPTAAVWFDTKEVRFVTSTAFGAALPAWVETHGSRAAVMGALVPWSARPGPSGHDSRPAARRG